MVRRDLVGPINISAPQVTVVSATILKFTWRSPDVYTGPLTRYVLTAYSDNDTAPALKTSVSPPFTTGQPSSSVISTCFKARL